MRAQNKDVDMTLNKTLLAALVITPLAFGFATHSFSAENNAETGEVQINETQALMNSKISIGDAIKTAEMESKGKAVDSGLNDENGVVSYQVEILMANGKRTDVFVDLETGKVLKMTDAGTGEGDQSAENGEGDEQVEGTN